MPHEETSWRMAAMATGHCLVGCAAGEVVGMVLAAAIGFGNVTTIVVSFVLAFVFGYSLTMRGVLSRGLALRRALRLALAADTVSILVMEVVDNGSVLVVPGALSTWLFWWSLAASLALAFLVATPVNRWLISRGRGHAVIMH